MNRFEDLKIKKPLKNAIADLGFEKPTPIQQESYSTVLGGFDYVGIAQTRTRFDRHRPNRNRKNNRVLTSDPTGLEIFRPT